MTPAAPPTILTIGHSSLAYGQFAGRLNAAGVTAVADVRSSPFSRRFPWFSRDDLKARLREDGIAYAFLGGELGGRPTDDRFFREGLADYEIMATTESFRAGLDRVLAGARKHRIALTCSERHPLDCHRCLLVGRALAARGAKVEHLLSDGAMQTHDDIELRLLEMAAKERDDLFAPRDERLGAAYREHARKVAFAVTARRP